MTDDSNDELERTREKAAVAYYKCIISAFAWWGWTSVAMFLLESNGKACNFLALSPEYTVAVKRVAKRKRSMIRTFTEFRL
jgi:hypothetical protein